METALTGPDLELTIGGRLVQVPRGLAPGQLPVPGCVAPGTGQKLKDITDLPNGVAISAPTTPPAR